MNVRFNSYCMWTEKKYEDDWYDWCIFVDEDSQIIDTIKSVEYTLHPTFPNPIRILTDKLTRFALFSSGWGGFGIRIKITFHDASTYSTSYFLNLRRDDWPKKPAPKSFADDKTKSVYGVLLHEKYRWRKLETIIRNTNLSKSEVQNILNELQEEGFVRKATFLSIDNKDLWGATAVVGISPRI